MEETWSEMGLEATITVCTDAYIYVSLAYKQLTHWPLRDLNVILKM